MCCRNCKATRQDMLEEGAVQPPPNGLTIASHLVSITGRHFLANRGVPRYMLVEGKPP